MRSLDNRNGMSLIEILAALVVFTIGILTVARVFPGGLGIVKQSEYATVADRLAQGELERLKKNSANLPDGIYCKIPADNTGNPTDQVLASPVSNADGYMASDALDPTNLSPLLDVTGKSYDYPNSPYYFSDINKFRHVEGESTPIPAKSPTSADGGSIYVPMFSPTICMDRTDARFFTSASTDPLNNPIKVYSGPLERIPISSSGIPSFAGTFQYSIDYSAGKLYLLPVSGYDRTFLIKCSYWDSVSSGSGESPRLRTSDLIQITVAKCTDTVLPSYISVDLATYIPGYPTDPKLKADFMVPGSDSLHREFSRQYAKEQSNDPDVYNWSSSDVDPYEYKVLNPFMGIISFNPIGYGKTETTARGRVPFKAYIDYDVADWHIIREDHVIPLSAQNTKNPTLAAAMSAGLSVKLAVPFIKHRVYGAEYLATAYQGLYKSYLPYDIAVVDLTDGNVYGSSGNSIEAIPLNAQIADNAWDDGSFSAYKIDYSAGQLSFNPYFAGHTLRIHYKAEHDWGVQAYTAYSLFSQHYLTGLSTAALQYGNVSYNQFCPEYATDGSGNALLDSSNQNIPLLTGKIYFGQCYTGRSVAVDYAYLTDQAHGSKQVTVRGQIFRVALDDSKHWSVDLAKYLTNSGQDVNTDWGTVDATKARLLRITRVYGVTLGVRVVYKNTLSAKEAWKVKSLETYLLRTQ